VYQDRMVIGRGGGGSGGGVVMLIVYVGNMLMTNVMLTMMSKILAVMF
jgi:hypothetical protein